VLQITFFKTPLYPYVKEDRLV